MLSHQMRLSFDDFSKLVFERLANARSHITANPGPSMMSHGLIVVPRSLRMF